MNASFIGNTRSFHFQWRQNTLRWNEEHKMHIAPKQSNTIAQTPTEPRLEPRPIAT
ncbi:hypothetical protein BgiBS90_018691, partial [Biomphalaria glabrata]